MNTFVTACAWLQARLGATVLVVTHTGKDETKGMRGASSLKGATDATISVRRSKNARMIVKAEKQKDDEEGDAVSFGMAKVVFPDGKSTLVVDLHDVEVASGDAVAEAARVAKRLTMLEVLQESADQGGLNSGDWLERVGLRGVGKNTFYELLTDMKAEGLIKLKDRRYVTTD